jgi:hypothetical protein
MREATGKLEETPRVYYITSLDKDHKMLTERLQIRFDET